MTVPTRTRRARVPRGPAGRRAAAWAESRHVDLRDLVRRDIPPAGRRVDGHAQRRGAADVEQGAIDGLAVAQHHELRAGVDLGLRFRARWRAIEVDHGNLGWLHLAFLSVDANSEAHAAEVNELTSDPLTGPHDEGGGFLRQHRTRREDRDRCERAERRESVASSTCVLRGDLVTHGGSSMQRYCQAWKRL